MDSKRSGFLRCMMAAHYFLYFGVMGIFLPYFNLYCFHLGFDGFQIGVLSAMRSVSMVLFPVLWSMAADRFRIRRGIFVLCSFSSAIIWTAFLFTAEFHMILIISIVYGVFYSPMISFMEAFTMDILEKDKSSYGRVRAWGTIAFIFISGGMGKLIDLYSVRLILIMILAGSLVQALLSPKVPRISGQGRKYGKPDFLFRARPLVFLFCAFLMLVSHGTYYGFFSIHLETLGYSKTFIGLAWALASVAEIGVMMSSARIFKRFAIEKVLLFSFGAACCDGLSFPKPSPLADSCLPGLLHYLRILPHCQHSEHGSHVA
ncbi:MAG: MFS transporter [Desulfobacterales bacterium]